MNLVVFGVFQHSKLDIERVKDRIEGMESDARYIKKLEGVLSDYTEEELEVRKHKVNIKDEQLARLVCYHPSTDQMVNYRIHTTPDGIVTVSIR